MQRFHVPPDLFLVFLWDGLTLHLLGLDLRRPGNLLDLEEGLARGGVAIEGQGPDNAPGGIELLGMDLLLFKARSLRRAGIALPGSLAFIGTRGVAPAAF